MTAPHFFATDVGGDRVVLTGDDARHAVGSLRIRAGETITVSDGAGTVVTARVVAAGEALEADVTGRVRTPAPRPRITVYQALAKHPKMDEVVARLSELGVACIVPFAGARSVARWDAAKASAQHRRLGRIAREAAMQSRQAYLPEVGLLAASGDIPAGAVVLHEEAPRRLGAVLPEEAPGELGLVVGPEGGLDPEEVSLLEARGCVAVGLGPAVLRAENAGFAAVCVVLSKYGLLG